MRFQQTILVTLLLLFVATASAQDTSQQELKAGNKLVAEEKYELAIAQYRQVSKTDANVYAQALYNIGVCYYELWHTVEAIDYYKRAIALRHGRYPMASYALGVAFEDERRLKEARLAYKQALAASPDNFPLSSFKLGLLAAYENDFRTAANFFRAAAAHAGVQSAASHNNLGVMLARLGRLSEAEIQFNAALQATSGNFDDAAKNLKLCQLLMHSSEVANIKSFSLTRLSKQMKDNP